MTHPRVGRVLVVADDLTGANDTGVQFAEAGWSTTLQLSHREPAAAGWADGSVVAVSTDNRAADADVASAATTQAISAQQLGVDDRLYLKLDSTLRGSVAAQVHGALRALESVRPDSVVVLCPAYPSMGRTVDGGRLLVNGRSVTESPAGVDPVTPVLVDGVVDLVPGAASIGRADSAAQWAAAIEDAATAVVAVDAVTDDDLVLLADALDLIGPRAVPAGSAGLAAPLAARWGGSGRPARRSEPAGRPLFLVSSHHAAAREQVAALAEHVAVVSTDAHRLLSGLRSDVPAEGPVALVSPDDRAGSYLAADLATALAEQASTWMAEDPTRFDAVVLVGGDGAEAFLRRVAAQGIAVRGRLLEGVPDGRIVGGAHDGLAVVTKAGGFGDPTTLTTILHSLRTTTDSETSR